MTMTPAAELDLIFAAPVPVSVGGKELAVRGVTLVELPAFLRLYDKRPKVADGDTSPEATEALVDWQADLVAMLARLAGVGIDTLAGLDDADLGRLFAAMRQANRILFEPNPARHGPRGAKGISWATACAQLVECGHSLAAIGGYTLAQIEQLTAAHARLAADRAIDELTTVRAAQADRKSYRQALAALKRARAMLG